MHLASVHQLQAVHRVALHIEPAVLFDQPDGGILEQSPFFLMTKQLAGLPFNRYPGEPYQSE